MNIKLIFSTISIAVAAASYIPYFRDIFKNKTKPHLFSWFIFSITTGIIFALQMQGGAGVGGWITLILAFIFFAIFILSIKYGTKDIKFIDIIFLVLALLAIPIWLIAKQPIISVLLLTTIDMLGFAPTIRKSWNNPYSETLSMYAITIARYVLVFPSLEAYNILTLIFPIVWFFANVLLVIVLVHRRKIVPQVNI
ncbi:MAG: hypothetical protein NT068_02780 [Candidatus Nomurabacteria bacterium]|nr:hypothetical protein [Candidatus Nomurabacteria bacterium]